MITKGKRVISSITYFFLGEYFSDALRTTLTVIIPIIFFFYLGNREAATGIGVGALLISLTDLPDNRFNKFRTALLSLAFFSFTTFLVSQVLDYPIFKALVITFLAFAFSLLSVYGQKMGLIGTMSLIVCAFVMGLHPPRPIYFSGYMLLGGIWYYMISLIQTVIRPYRSLNHAIFECLMASAEFLKAKAKNYDPSIPLDHQQKEIIKLHIRVNQKHELIRNLLLTDRYAMDPENNNGQILLARAGFLIDLYEQLNAVHFDYENVRQTLAGTDVLPLIASLIAELAEEIEALEQQIRSKNNRPSSSKEVSRFLESRVLLIQKLPALTETQTEFVKNVLANVDEISSIIASIRNKQTFTAHHKAGREKIAFPRFLSSDRFALSDHLTLKSPIFRFSLRMAICFLFGFILISQFQDSKYSYWLFLTLVIVARPKFSITWKRNFQRLKGSLGGIVIGLVLVYIIKSSAVLLCTSAICLLGFYAFNRINYTISVLFITPAVILTLGSYHGHFDHIVHARILYTAIGCAIAIMATYLFPIWDSKNLHQKIKEAADASLKYFMIATTESNQGENTARLARKNANLSLSSLSESIESASQEPQQSSTDLKNFYELQVIIYKINAMVTSIFLSGERVNQNFNDQIFNEIHLNLNLSSESSVNRLESNQQSIGEVVANNALYQKLLIILSLSANLNECYKIS
ncbi:FUSC family protein [Pedobacter sp. MC2016-05]|uniref:FUSC family protein n=1 Tax=Pedobacter sp. MC2016-05 TaxID=2994474 RepID=UPI0022473877|nr:FUSC family membrane protein [Pedobacter sp. MC2016-05]MCX2475005.1 FUSC family protein [Pedobacter sp. MC2016-05]